MAEAITYADLRFVKAPMKNATCQLGQDEDEDGDLTYENVQVCPAPGVIANLASSGSGDKAGTGCLGSEQQPPPWPSSTAPATRRILPGQVTCTQYVLLGLLLVCLLLGVAAICLGVRYLQVSQQLQRTHGVLESTNSSLGQQLHLAWAQLEQKKKDLQVSRQELTQSQERLSRKEQEGMETQEKLEDCDRDRKETRDSLMNEESQKRTLNEKLEKIREKLEKLKGLYTCNNSPVEGFVGSMEDSCCPVGWKLIKRSCFHISLTKRSWQDSQEYCKSLSSELASVSSYSFYSQRETRDTLYSWLEQLHWSGPYWIRSSGRGNGYEKRCIKMETYWQRSLSHNCDTSLTCICELAAFRHEDVEHLLH